MNCFFLSNCAAGIKYAQISFGITNNSKQSLLVISTFLKTCSPQKCEYCNTFPKLCNNLNFKMPDL